jgi:hypothetical protein
LGESQAKRYLRKISGTLEKNNLPPIIHLEKRKYVISPEFAEKFGVKDPGSALMHLLSETQRKVFMLINSIPEHNKISGGRGSLLGISRSLFSFHRRQIGRILAKTHFTGEAEAGMALNLHPDAIPYLFKPTVFRNQRYYLKSLNYHNFSEDQVNEAQIKGILDSYMKRLLKSSTTPDEKPEAAMLSKVSEQARLKLGQAFESELSHMGEIRPIDTERSDRARYLRVGLIVLDESLNGSLRRNFELRNGSR